MLEELAERFDFGNRYHSLRGPPGDKRARLGVLFLVCDLKGKKDETSWQGKEEVFDAGVLCRRSRIPAIIDAVLPCRPFCPSVRQSVYGLFLSSPDLLRPAILFKTKARSS